jgi:hypothetical protein
VWERRVACRVFVLRPEVKRQIGRPRCRWEHNIKIDHQEIGCGGLEWFEVTSEQVAGLFEQGNERFLYPKSREFVEIKCQLDATDEFLLQILLLDQHVSGTIMPIIRSSRVLYRWFLPVVFDAWFSSCRHGVELRVVCPVCGLLMMGIMVPETC